MVIAVPSTLNTKAGVNQVLRVLKGRKKRNSRYFLNTYVAWPNASPGETHLPTESGPGSET